MHHTFISAPLLLSSNVVSSVVVGPFSTTMKRRSAYHLSVITYMSGGSGIGVGDDATSSPPPPSTCKDSIYHFISMVKALGKKSVIMEE